MHFSQHQRARASLIGTGALILALLACSAPAGTQPTATQAGPPLPQITPSLPQGATEVAAPATTDSLPPAPTTDPGVQVTATNAPPAAPAANADYNGISFYRSNDLASGWEVEITPVGDGQGPFASPSHYSFTLTGYKLVDTYRVGSIEVYPLANFNDQYPDQNAEIARLQEFLKTKAADVPEPDDIPFVALLTAPQVFHVQLQYTQFQNGEGVRFITATKHDVSPITNREIFYTFQGLTNDGRYYVSVVLPISHPSLPFDYPLEGAEAYDTFSANYEPYLEEIITTLNSADPDSFSPALSLLDELVHSLTIAPAP